MFNNLGLRINSALDGLGIVYIPEDQALPHIAKGKLVRVLEDWCLRFPATTSTIRAAGIPPPL